MHIFYDLTILIAAFLIFLGVSYIVSWFVFRITAARCPQCGTRWLTEVTGDWDGKEDWYCHGCGHHWMEKY